MTPLTQADTLVDQLRCLLVPRSIAVVGASSDLSKVTGRALKHLMAHGYTGDVYPVNPGSEEVAGLRCYPSVHALPRPVDTAFVQVAAAAVPGVLQQCVQRGVRSVMVHTAGLGEGGGDEREALDRLKATAIGAGLPLLGPNCAGVANVSQDIILSPIACYDMKPLTKGRIGLVSHSGGLTGAYVSRAEERGIGFSCIVSTGNELVLEASHFVEYFVRDPGTDVIALFIETLRDVPRFHRAADAALSAGKPIVVLKIGRTAMGARVAASHTGALTGSDAVYDAIFRQKGVTRVDTFEDLLEVSALFAKTGPPAGRRVGVVTTTGGSAALVVEAAAAAGLEFPIPAPPDDGSDDPLPEFAIRSNPIDVTMSGVGDGFRRELIRMLDDDTFDVVVGVLGTSSQFQPELAVQPLVDAHQHARKPLVAFCSPAAPFALRLFEARGIPSFRTPEGCGRALGYLVRRGEFLRRRADLAAERAPAPSGRAARARAALGTAGRVLDEHQSKLILAAYGVSIVRERVARSLEEALAAAAAIGYPVAVKVLSPDVAHKTDVDAIALGIASPSQLRAAHARVLAAVRAHAPTARVTGVLIQEMVAGGIEVILGVSRDPHIGPVVMFGLGGVLIEVLEDVAFRALPIARADAVEMIAETKAARLLRGHRGRPPGDIDALVDTLLRVSEMAVDLGGELAELDINPLIVGPSGTGVRVVDALMVRHQPA